MCTYRPGHAHSGSAPVQNPPRRLSRRALIKASAAFAAMAAASPHLSSAPAVVAQEGATRATDWTQPVAVGGDGDYMGFSTDFSFNAIAPHWPGNLETPAVVEVQLSEDGETWTDPVIIGPAHTDAGPEDRDGRTFGELLHVESASMVRYRPLDADGNLMTIPGLTFTYIDAKAGPSIEDLSSRSTSPTSGRPPIITREEWGAARAYGGADKGTLDWTPQYQTVRHVIIHHSETPNFRNPLVEIRSIHYYHAITRGWGDIGYNYLVDYMGNVYEGRAGGENVIGGHAFQYAHGSAGICTMGSFKSKHVTPESIAGLTWISAWAARKLSPLAKNDFHETPSLPTICGHRDVVDSTCPGDGLYADLPTIRSAVAQVLAGNDAVVQDPDFSPGQTVQTVVEGGNMRVQPGTGQSVATTLAYGTIMHIADGPTTTDGYTWYQLTGNRGTGWMATTLFKASNAEPATGEFAVGDRVQVETDMLNIRSKASIAASVNATIQRGTTGSVLEGPRPAGGFRWYRLETAAGRGWAVEQYLVPEGTAKPTSRFLVGDHVAVADRDGVRMRALPGTASAKIASLPYGTSGTVIGEARLANGIGWLEIQTRLGSGWVGEPYLTSSETGPETEAKFERGDEVVVTSDSVNMRESPGTNRPIIRTLGKGIAGTVTEPSHSANNLWWARINTSQGTGWVMESFLSDANGDSGSGGDSPSFAIGATVYVDTDGINLRGTPGTSGKKIAILYTSEKAKVVDGPKDGDGYVWYKLESARGTGWGVATYLAAGSSDPGSSTGTGAGDTVRVNSDNVNLRDSPGLSGKKIGTLGVDATGTVVDGPRKADGYSWFKLKTSVGTGWSVSTWLELASSGTLGPGATARVFDGELNLRKFPGTDGSVIGVLADGASVSVIDGPKEANGYIWLKVTSSKYGTGWCTSKYLKRA